MSPQGSILICDACPLMRWSLVQSLHNRYRVCEAVSGEQALSALRLHPYDILILGCGCCDLSCRELVGQSKQIQPALQVVLLSNLPADQTECDCYPIDIRCFYEKPLDLNDLLSEIDGIVATIAS